MMILVLQSRLFGQFGQTTSLFCSPTCQVRVSRFKQTPPLFSSPTPLPALRVWGHQTAWSSQQLLSLGTHGPEQIPERCNKKVPDRMSECISGRMQEWMPDRMSLGGDHSKNIIHCSTCLFNQWLTGGV